MSREEVYKLIDGERDYQDSKWVSKERPYPDAETSVAAWLIYIEFHLALAKSDIYLLAEGKALEQIRKITALGVACMENNETSPRPKEEIT